MVYACSNPHRFLIACTPALVTIGYIRLRIVVLKDQKNKKAHDASAQLACEAAGAIRTVAALTREEDCLEVYSKSLEEPLRKSNRTAIWSNLLYSFSQGITFFVIALVFWYGSRLVSRQQATLFQFFVGLMVSAIDPLHMFIMRILNSFIEHGLQRHSSWECIFIRPRCLLRPRCRF